MEVNEFDTKKLRHGMLILATCEHKESLSNMLNGILQRLECIPGAIFTKNPLLYPNQKNIHADFHQETLKEIWEKQQEMFEHRNVNKENDRRTFVVFDNCFPDGTWLQNTHIQRMFSMNRIFAITGVFGFTKIYAFPPRMRNEIDCIWIGPHTREIEKRRLYEQFINNATYEEFSELLEKHTTHGWLIIEPNEFHTLSFVKLPE